MILVTGATGTVGSEVVRQLIAAGQPARALVRPGSAVPKLNNGAEIAAGDAGRPQTLEAALRGVERLYLLLPMTPALRQWDAGVIAAAQGAGVQLVVKHSNMGAEDEAGTTMQRWHRAGEMLIEKSGMAWTFIRPTGYMTNALGWAGMIKSQGAVYAPGGDGRLAVVDPRDIAAVAVAALTEPGHEGRAYDVTGPEALSAAEQVKTISDEIGKPVTHIDIPESAARESMISTGMPAEIAEALTEFMTDVRAGRSATVSDAVMRVTGRPARTFAAWAHENAAVFQ
ncbi:MAG: SDR family oxidoreductase [Streptosporangiaceae bacterium]